MLIEDQLQVLGPRFMEKSVLRAVGPLLVRICQNCRCQVWMVLIAATVLTYILTNGTHEPVLPSQSHLPNAEMAGQYRCRIWCSWILQPA
jgi:hypothetical protein